MNDEEKRIAEELHFCSFQPASTAKRFARDMYARRDAADPLTPKQRGFLYALRWHYRLQIIRHYESMRATPPAIRYVPDGKPLEADWQKKVKDFYQLPLIKES
jgi:hypothetical protein